MTAMVSSEYTSSSDLPPKPRKALAWARSEGERGLSAITRQRDATQQTHLARRKQLRAQDGGHAGERQLSAAHGRLVDKALG